MPETLPDYEALLASIPEHRYQNINDYRISLYSFGRENAPITLLFLHGFAGQGAEALSLGRHLSADGQIRVLAPDYPDCGFSQLCQTSPGMDGFVAFTQSFIDWAAALAKKNKSRLVLSGHSTGVQMICNALLDTSYQAPSIHRLIFVAPNGLQGEEGPMLKLRARWLTKLAKPFFNHGIYRSLAKFRVYYQIKNVDPVILQLGLASMFRPGAWEASENYLLDTIGHDPLDGRLAALDQATLILWGRKDKVLNFSYSQTFLAQLPNAKLVSADKTGHGLHSEAAAWAANQIKDFLFKS